MKIILTAITIAALAAAALGTIRVSHAVAAEPEPDQTPQEAPRRVAVQAKPRTDCVTQCWNWIDAQYPSLDDKAGAR